MSQRLINPEQTELLKRVLYKKLIYREISEKPFNEMMDFLRNLKPSEYRSIKTIVSQLCWCENNFDAIILPTETIKKLDDLCLYAKKKDAESQKTGLCYDRKSILERIINSKHNALDQK